MLLLYKTFFCDVKLTLAATKVFPAGDVADQVGANIVIMSVEAIHAKLVDANLLAEFVPCPMLLLP